MVGDRKISRSVFQIVLNIIVSLVLILIYQLLCCNATKLSINAMSCKCQWSRRLDSNQCIHPYEGGALASSATTRILVRARGIEPLSEHWQCSVLPFN
jgi:hypothetical protein